MTTRRTTYVACGLCVLYALSARAEDVTIYYGAFQEDGSLYRADFDPSSGSVSNTQRISLGAVVAAPRTIIGNELYLGDGNHLGQGGTIYRTQLENLATLSEIVTFGADGLYSVDVDPVAGTIYASGRSAGDPFIFRANLDGTNISSRPAGGSSSRSGVVIDGPRQNLYWTSSDTLSAKNGVLAVPADSFQSPAELLAQFPGFTSLRGLAFDPSSNNLFGVASIPLGGLGNSLFRVNLNSGSYEILADLDFHLPDAQWWDTRLDVGAGRVYFGGADFNSASPSQRMSNDGVILSANMNASLPNGSGGDFLDIDIKTVLTTFDPGGSHVVPNGNFVLSIAGSSQYDPVLPENLAPDPLEGWQFTDMPGGGIWCDPELADAYRFVAEDGDMFVQVGLPVGLPDDDGFYTITDSMGGSVQVAEGEYYSFLEPISEFIISGIGPPVESEDPLAFPVFLKFNQPTASFNMIPLSSSISAPEPMSVTLWLLLGIGLAISYGRTCHLKTC